MARAEARKETEPADPWMTLNQAAAALGVSRPTVLARIVAGELEGKHEAGRTLVTRASVEQALAQKNGRSKQLAGK